MASTCLGEHSLGLKSFDAGDLAVDLAEDHLHCVDNVKTFTECFLFSLETQHTIG